MAMVVTRVKGTIARNKNASQLIWCATIVFSKKFAVVLFAKAIASDRQMAVVSKKIRKVSRLVGEFLADSRAF